MSHELNSFLQGVAEMGKGPVGRWGVSSGPCPAGAATAPVPGGGGAKKNFLSFFSFLRNFGEFFCNFYNFVIQI